MRNMNVFKTFPCLVWLPLFCMAFLFSQHTSAQPKASPDNVFVSPSDPYAFWDVLKNDNPGDCLPYETLEMQIVTPPHHALLCYVESNYIFYMPSGGFAGRDSLEYEITCNGQSSRAKVYINLSDMPDNVTLEVCHVPIPAIGWEIKELSRSENIVSNFSVPLCGDIDGDGEIEILIKDAIGTGDYGPSDRIYIFSVRKEDNELYLKDSIMTVPTSTASQFMMANVDGGKYTSIFVTTDTRDNITEKQLLVKYSYNEAVAGYQEAWRVPYSTHPDYPGGIPVIADFAGDGRTQVVVYDKVFNAVDGTLLADGGYQGNDYYSFGRIGHTPVHKENTGRWTAACMTVADIDGDGLPEVIGGDCVYKVTITNHSGMAGNSFDFMVKADATGRPDVGDGAIAIADMDLDGQLDVVVTHKMFLTDPSIIDKGSVYIYNPRTGEIMNDNMVDDIPVRGTTDLSNLAGPSIPFLGDVDNDGYAEIALTGARIMMAYKYNPVTKHITKMWERVTSDTSASTTMSLFDFTQSGEAQLVYRDEDSLRIINGATGITLAGYAESASSTVDEYPIIADVNGDGAAEIIVPASNTAQGRGSLRIYGSAGVPWAPARTVWNRMDYNPVYVNEDLTIPRYPMNPATPFFSDAGVVRPFNNYLQQGTWLNDEGEMLYEASDLQFDPYRRPVLIIDDTGDKIAVDIRIGNVGDKDFYPPLSVSLYVYNSGTDVYTHLNTTILNDTVLVGTTRDLTYDIPGYSTLPFPVSYDHWLLFLNSGDDSPSVPVYPYVTGEEECYYWNNRSANLSFTYGERIMCMGESEEVTLSPDGVYTYKWYDAAVGGNLIAEGDNYVVTKDANVVQRYFVDTYSMGTGAKLNAVRDTVHIYLTPDSLVWNGIEDSDWHNFSNWHNPSVSGTDPYPRRNIPRKCTNVLIPDGVVRYPDLTDLPGSGTSYEEYLTPECGYIHFLHGGEVRRTDLLDYDRAGVELQLNANRWYMLSAPLRSLFTGDYYEIDANPHLDNVEVYTRLYRSINPETGLTSTDAWGWSGVFHNPHVEMEAGMGVSFWLDNREDISVVTSHTFTFPKHEDYYHVYARGGHIHHTVSLDRQLTFIHKFIFFLLP